MELLNTLNYENPIDFDEYPNVYLGYQYAIDVVLGKIPNCKFVIGACKRFFLDLKTNFYIFDIPAAERYLRLSQMFSHVKGKGWKSENIQFEPWQHFIFMNIMGWKDPRTNERRFRVAHVEVPRGQGKSLMASQAVLYFLALDNPKGNEISCASTKTEQARIVLDSARAMAKSNKKYLDATGVEVLAHKIVHDKSNSFVRALSSDSKSLDGLNDVLCIMDELHAVSRELFDVIFSGMKKRNDSLLLCITTAGFDMEGVGYSQSQYAKKIALGEIDDGQFFSMIFTVDEEDDIFSELAWRKANPNYGVSVDPITFEATAKKAAVVPSDLPNFKVKNLNIWLSEAGAYYDVVKWDECADPTLKFEDFYGRYCYAAIDLASKVDLTSFGFLFKKDGHYYFFDKSHIPQKTVDDKRNAFYDNCIGQGYLHTTVGEAINYPKLEEEFLETTRNIKIHAAHYDPWNATQFAQNLEKKYINMVEFRMTMANFSEAMKTLDALIREKKIHHNGSPLLRFCLGNVVAKRDAAENVYPTKNNESLKIDPIVCLLMCLAGWIQEKEEESAYENHGVRYL